VRDVDTLLVVAHEPAPSGHPSEGALDDPAAWQDLEAVLAVGSADDLDDELEVGGLVHKFEPVVGAVGEQVLHPGPPLANVVQDRLGARVSDMSAVVRLTIKSRPSVSTAMWRLRPTIFLPAS
jgi:hypothetical protein